MGFNTEQMLRAELQQERRKAQHLQLNMGRLASFCAALVARTGDLAAFVPMDEIEAAQEKGAHKFMPATGKPRTDPEANGSAEEPEEVEGMLFSFVPREAPEGLRLVR